MAVYCLKGYLSLILLSGIIFNSQGAKVQLYKDSDFKGEMLELTSSASCTCLPGTFKNLNGSIKITGCAVLYRNPNCSQEGRFVVYHGINGDGYVVRLEETRLNQKYIPSKQQNFYVNSIKDCTEKETKSTVDFDYYEEMFFGGKLEQIKDICKCTNLPKSSFQFYTWRSANTYGNCFKIYKTSNCVGESYFTTNVMWNSLFYTDFVSIEPCDLPRHCTRNFVSSKKQLQVPSATNYGNKTLEIFFEVPWETNETSNFEVPNEFTQLKSVNILGSNDVDLDTDLRFPENSSAALRSAILFKALLFVLKHILN